MFLTVFTNIFFSLVFTGGMIGWLKKGSLASLIASTISAGLLALGIYGLDVHPEYANASAGLLTFTSVFLLVFSILRLSKKEGKFMPAGLILLLATAELCLLWLRLYA